MSCVVVLCVIILVSQINILPLSQEIPKGQMSLLSQTSESPAGPLSKVKGHVGQTSTLDQEGSPVVVQVLSRVRRTVIGSAGCAEGMVRLGGYCVTCEE